MVELPQQQPLLRSRPLNLRKVMATEPRVAWVRHVADVDSLTHQENAQYGVSIVTNVDIKITSVHIVGPGTEEIPKTETNMDQTVGAVKAPESHGAREEAGAGIGDMHQMTQRIDQEVDPPPEVPTA